MPNIKAWRIGDQIRFITSYGERKVGRVICRYPDTKLADVVDAKGHAWMVYCG